MKFKIITEVDEDTLRKYAKDTNTPLCRLIYNEINKYSGLFAKEVTPVKESKIDKSIPVEEDICPACGDRMRKGDDYCIRCIAGIPLSKRRDKMKRPEFPSLFNEYRCAVVTESVEKKLKCMVDYIKAEFDYLNKRLDKLEKES